jgi:hypothetical protein
MGTELKGKTLWKIFPKTAHLLLIIPKLLHKGRKSHNSRS